MAKACCVNGHRVAGGCGPFRKHGNVSLQFVTRQRALRRLNRSYRMTNMWFPKYYFARLHGIASPHRFPTHVQCKVMVLDLGHPFLSLHLTGETGPTSLTVYDCLRGMAQAKASSLSVRGSSCASSRPGSRSGTQMARGLFQTVHRNLFIPLL